MYFYIVQFNKEREVFIKKLKGITNLFDQI